MIDVLEQILILPAIVGIVFLAIVSIGLPILFLKWIWRKIDKN